LERDTSPVLPSHGVRTARECDKRATWVGRVGADDQAQPGLSAWRPGGGSGCGRRAGHTLLPT
jgi:hypothetical protein